MTEHAMMMCALGGGAMLACCLTAGAADKRLPLTGQVFEVQGRPAFWIMPEKVTPGRRVPWVWYAPTLIGLPGPEEGWMFERLVAEGIAIAGIDVGESYGSPKGAALFQSLYDELVRRRDMSPRPALLARSRGGLMLYNWAAEHPDSVGAIAGIYPVCNLASYPGLAKACRAYEMSEQELAARLTQHNPIDRLAPLAKAKVPLFHLHGDHDKTVPLEDNSAIVKQRYDALGGNMTLQIIKGGGHDMKSHWFQSQALVDFVIQHVRPDTEE